MSNDDTFDFVQQAAADLEFDMTNVDKLSLRIPMLQEKYARLMMQFKADLKVSEIDLKALEADTIEYYTTHYPLKIDRRDMDKYVWKDDKFRMAAKRHEALKIKVEYLKDIQNALNQASWNINNAIKMHLWKSGHD